MQNWQKLVGKDLISHSALDTHQKQYQRGLNLLIHKDPNDFRHLRLFPILILYIEANMNNKHLGIIATS